MTTSQRLYCVERRQNLPDAHTLTVDSNCFVGSTVGKCVDFMKNNTDFEPVRDPQQPWYWVIIILYLDVDQWDPAHQPPADHMDMHSVYDWEGNVLEEQP